MKRILITGANSYIGTSAARWLGAWPERYAVDTVDMIGGAWRERSFAGYDAVFHVAGLAHQKETAENAHLYALINRDLAIETAQKAKADGVRHFIFLSSISVYGMNAGVIARDTVPAPKTHYGRSKLEAEAGIRALECETFRAAILRPPMVYGKGCRGNYSTLSALARRLPLFPDADNRRSMLYIGNLCEFVRLLVEHGACGLFWPQDAQYARTSELARTIAAANGKRIRLTKAFNFLLPAAMRHVTAAEKAFGSLCIRQDMSVFAEPYQLFGTREAIRRSEARTGRPRVLVLANHSDYVYKLRREVLEALLARGYDVCISCPDGAGIPELTRMGCRHIRVDSDRHGKNPFEDLGVLLKYLRIIKSEQPDVVLTYTIKQNVYGGIAARLRRVPYLANITGLGSALSGDGALQKLTVALHRVALRRARCVFFQNTHNEAFFAKRRILRGHTGTRLLPGSGVNTARFLPLPYPQENESIRFLFIGRLMREKGILEYISAAQRVRAAHADAAFDIIGFCDDDSVMGVLNDAVSGGAVLYHGMQADVRPFIARAHAVVLPSYAEGMSNVLLEAAASARPVITTTSPGCAETFEEGVTGLGVAPRDADSLADALTRFIRLPYEEKVGMGRLGRVRMERMFSRDIVVAAYLDEIDIILNEGIAYESV